MTSHRRQAIREEFARQAPEFEDPTRAFGRPDVLAWVAENVPTKPDDLVLEVAAGTGWVARALSPLVRAVIATDVTPEMLEAGKRAADASGIGNIVFQEADAADLPFLDDSFDRVACRLAVHHFDEPDIMLAEMVRVCRPGGVIVVIDMVAPSDATVAAVLNEIERLRDPTHTRALPREELHAAVTRAGGTVSHAAARENPMLLSRWLAQTSTADGAASRIRALLEHEIDGGASTGLHPRRVEDDIEFEHHWELVVGDVRR